MTEATGLERVLRRDRMITIAGLAILCILAWIYVVAGAGLGMPAWRMTAFSLSPYQPIAPGPNGMPHVDMPGMDSAPAMAASAAPTWSMATWILIATMWWAMMIAMMTPSAAPIVLLYARVYRHAVAQGQIDSKRAPTGAFAAGYILTWLCFAATAAGLQWILVRAGLVSGMMMWSQSHWLSGGFLIAAGLYQISPLKHLCLAHCRAPSQFLSRHWRPGRVGALRMGALHGAFCVGCCWALMALLFVGGVMNLIWIAALTALVLLEKLAPGGQRLGRVVGIALMAWGVITLLA